MDLLSKAFHELRSYMVLIVIDTRDLLLSCSIKYQFSQLWLREGFLATVGSHW